MPTHGSPAHRSLRDILRVPAGPVDLADHDPAATPLAPGKKSATKKALAEQGSTLAALQEKLYAAGQEGASRRVLLVLQGMDTCGKDGVVKHVIGLMNPQGVQIHSFKTPTEEERQHDFLWRIRAQVPGPGMVGIFNRSHYEDVLVVRVHNLVPPEVWRERYDQINEFERKLADEGVTVLKCFLNISYDEQRARLLARLDDPTKHWKFNPSDLDERARWTDYQGAYRQVLERCSPPATPWYAVPSDRKWYRNWAVSQLLLETLTELDPKYPNVDLDIPVLKARLAPPN